MRIRGSDKKLYYTVQIKTESGDPRNNNRRITYPAERVVSKIVKEQVSPKSSPLGEAGTGCGIYSPAKRKLRVPERF